jgi:tetratricopeptide (TPR) repeat protein
VNRGIAYASSGDNQKAFQDFGQAIQLDPKLSTAYVDRAGAYLRTGDTDAAIADLSKVIDLDPLHASKFLVARCQLYADKKEFAKALFDCNEAVAFSPNDATALEGRGQVNLASGKLDAAILDFNAALGIDPKRAPSLRGRGLARQRKGDVAGSRADQAAAQQIDPAIDRQTKQ